MKHLKTKTTIFIAAAMLASVAFIACGGEEAKTNNIITMTTSSARNIVLDMAGKEDVIIDWGDAIDTLKLSDTTASYSHDYSQSRAHDITITGNVTYLHVTYSNLTELDITKTTVLAELHCRNNNISALDASKCLILKYLDCSDNNFSVTALNELFGTLNISSVSKTIEIYANPGCDDCDRSIAERKGWRVGDCW
jgi:hypothetical protein